jgi:putative GTP pyrophosphokinase
MTNLDALQREYEANAERHRGLCRAILEQIDVLLREEGITLASPCEHRVKKWTSIVEKIERNQSAPQSLSDIRDVSGIRIIALFRRDIERIEKIIEANFEVTQKEDAFARLTENQFGYGSIHYEVMPPQGWSKIPTLKNLSGLHAEIQLRTGSQHIWAAASHSLQYKKETHVPPPLRRSINRVAAMLETVDLEFERVLLEREQYASLLSKDAGDQSLDTESLRALLDAVLPAKNRADGKEDYADLLDDLTHFNILTTGQLSAIIQKHLEKVLDEDQSTAKEVLGRTGGQKNSDEAALARVRAGVFYTHVGLCRACVQAAIGTSFRDYLAKKRDDTK